MFNFVDSIWFSIFIIRTKNKKDLIKKVCDFFKQKNRENNDYASHLAEFIRRSNEIERYWGDV